MNRTIINIIFASSISILIFCFAGCKESTKKNTANSSNFYLADVEVNYKKFTTKDTTEDAEINKFIAPYRDSLDKEMNVVIGQCSENMDKRKPNSKLGNWMTDIFVEEGEKIFNQEIDFAVQNYGGIRIPTLAKGPVTKSDIFELMPFDNLLVLLSLDSSVVHQLCNNMAEYGGWPISKGLGFAIKDSVATDIMIHGEPLNNSRQYKVLLPDYVANGGNSCFFLSDIEQINSGVFIRELIINNIIDNSKNNASILADAQIRIR